MFHNLGPYPGLTTLPFHTISYHWHKYFNQLRRLKSAVKIKSNFKSKKKKVSLFAKNVFGTHKIPGLINKDKLQQFYRTSVSRNKVNDLHLCLLNSGLKFLDKASFSPSQHSRTFLSEPRTLYMLSVFHSPQGTVSARISLHYIFPINVSSSYFSLKLKSNS